MPRTPPEKDDAIHYRCPRCGMLYRPWQQRPGYSKANKMYVLEQQAAVFVEDLQVDKGQVLVYPH